MALCAYWRELLCKNRPRVLEAPLEAGVLGNSWEVGLFQYVGQCGCICDGVFVDKNVMPA